MVSKDLVSCEAVAAVAEEHNYTLFETDSLYYIHGTYTRDYAYNMLMKWIHGPVDGIIFYMVMNILTMDMIQKILPDQDITLIIGEQVLGDSRSNTCCL